MKISCYRMQFLVIECFWLFKFSVWLLGLKWRYFMKVFRVRVFLIWEFWEYTKYEHFWIDSSDFWGNWFWFLDKISWYFKKVIWFCKMYFVCGNSFYLRIWIPRVFLIWELLNWENCIESSVLRFGFWYEISEGIQILVLEFINLGRKQNLDF